MSESNQQIDQRPRLKRALEALRDMRAKLESAQAGDRQPIAVVGMGCRFPGGVRNPGHYWRLLTEGCDAIGEVPADRWDVDAWYDPDPAKSGKISTRYGGFLDRVDEFDSQFFGIAPREADFIDPQQRLLLEVAWESLEHGAIAPERLRGSSTGVFVGISSGEYGQLLTAGGPESINHYAGSGNANSVAAGRIAYVLDLVGPAVSIDTACSSSLVAVHLACQSLRARQCEMALAGGVNILLTPTVSINHSRARMLAPDGRCKTFSASADGFVRSDGCGLVVLKRLDDALAAGDNIQAVIRGTASNQDGHTSALTVPSGPSQRAVIVQALEDAGISPRHVGYIEAHGTGTSLGDPIELNALQGVFGPTRAADEPLLVGSVKTNIGHAEASAGVAGLIKVVLSLQQQTIPPHLHFDRPTPEFDWDSSALRVPREGVAWRQFEGSRTAGVSSFGFGGTNAHLIVEEAPQDTSSRQSESPASPEHLRLLPLSAQSDDALRQLAASYARHVQGQGQLELADVCLTAGAGRSHFRHRAAALVDSLDGAISELRGISEGTPSRSTHAEVAGVDRPRIAFLFTGQGSQYAGMGRQLYESQPVFRAALQQCHELLRPHLEHPLLDVLYPRDSGSTLLNETAYTQPALFALEYSLAELWKSWGIVPDVVLGHSVGEFAAACQAGVIELEDALRLISARGRLMQALPGGAMAAVPAGHEYVATLIDRHAPEVSIAAINGPHNTVVSGAPQHLEALLQQLQADGIESQRLVVSHAFHSRMIEPMLPAFAEAARSVAFAAPQLDLISNLTGQLVDEGTIDAEYWCRHMRQAVRFSAGVETLLQQDCRLLVEVGPRPVLSGMGRQCVDDDQIRWLPSLRPGRPERQQLLESLAELYVCGADVRWSNLHDTGRRIELPTYPFQRRRHWAEAASVRDTPEPGLKAAAHPVDGSRDALLGSRIDCAGRPEEVVFQVQLKCGDTSLVDQHRIFGKPIMSSAGYLSMAHAAAKTVFQTATPVLQDVTFHDALTFDEHEEKTVQLIVNRADGAWKVYCRRDPALDPPQWTLHASGRASAQPLIPAAGDAGGSHTDRLAALRAKINQPLDRDDFYRAYADRGVEFGPEFQAVAQLWFDDTQALGVIEASKLDTSRQQNGLHPALLDAATQVVGAVGMSRAPTNGRTADGSQSSAAVWIQSGIDHYQNLRPAEGKLWAHASVRQTDQKHTRVADIRLLDDGGELVAQIRGLRSRPASAGTLIKGASSQAEHYSVQWLPRSRGDRTSPKRASSSPEAASLPANLASEVAATVRPQLDTVLAGADVVDYAQLLSELESLSPLYISRALVRLGWSPLPRDRFDADELAKQLGVQPEYSRLFNRALEILAEERLVKRSEGRWEVIVELPSGDFRERAANIRRRWASSAEFELLDRCGLELADVLSGRRDPLQLLFPNGDMSTAARVYGDSPGVKAISELLSAGVVQAVERYPAGRPLRVLEIGAGTGGTSAHVLPCLPKDRAEYVFTDISQHFLVAARKKFASFPFVRYQLLDIEQSPSEQGLDDHSFDMIVASNVLHATRNLSDTVRHASRLLAPSGLLWLLENVTPSNWVELIWGLTDGWWRFDDDLRVSQPLLSCEGWQQLLQANGFAGVESIAANATQHGHLSRQAILVAQRDSTQLGTQHTSGATTASADPPHLSAATSQPTGNDSRTTAVWLLFGDPGGLAESVSESLRAQGYRCVFVRRADRFAQPAPDLFDIDPNSRADFDRVLDFIGRDGDPLDGVLYMWDESSKPAAGATPSDVGRRVHAGFMRLVHLVQALNARSYEVPPALWLITRGAQPVSAPWTGLRPELSPLWSIGQVVALEHPELWGGMLDLDPHPQPGEVSAVVSELLDSDSEDRIAWRGGERLVARLTRSELLSDRPRTVRPDTSYLITGGCGALGLAAASWLVQHGARHLVLASRSGATSDSAHEAVSSLQEAGAQVHIVKADVSSQDDMTRLFGNFSNAWPRLAGIVHAAGRPGYRTLVEMDDETVHDVLAAKVTGTWMLHELTKELTLDFFVGCSSMVSVWGTKGQSHYGAANHFLDSVAHHRRGLGLPCLSVNWGPLTGGGMLPDEDVGDLKRLGVSTTPIQQAVEAFGQLLSNDVIQTTLVDIDWSTFKGVYESRRKRPLFELLGADDRISSSPRAGTGDNEHSIAARLRDSVPSERRELLCEHVQQVLAEVLGLFEAPDRQTGFFDMGLDSLTAMELRTQLERTLETSLPATLAFDHPTVESLAAFLEQEQFAPTSCSHSDAGASARPETTRHEPAEEAIEELSDEEVEALLLEKLEQLDA